MTRIRLVDLDAQRRVLGGRVEAAIQTVLAHGQFILGPEVVRLERELARRAGVGHCVSCGNGTEALVLALRALGFGPGDAVVVPAFTFAATAEAVVLAGATPVFADVRPDTFNIDVASAADAIRSARARNLQPVAVLAVDLFGQPADADELQKLAASEDMVLLVDAAQSLGARWRGRPVGSLAEVTTTSFFPSKPLGCYGDGGAILTDHRDVAERVRSLRAHGRGVHKYEHIEIGTNSRLDTIQAAVLLAKLTAFDDEVAHRREAAQRYSSLFADLTPTPAVADGAEPVWAHYTVVLPDRERVMRALAGAGIDAAVYYPTPLHRQPAYAAYPRAAGRLAVAEGLAERVVSIPMHPYLTPGDQEQVAAVVRRAIGGA